MSAKFHPRSAHFCRSLSLAARLGLVLVAGGGEDATLPARGRLGTARHILEAPPGKSRGDRGATRAV